ncbi:MFS transporter [Epidermidibacterium keratini]|uniref:MFS transporter n=1 Tax=Epidermidibacterium keratini TaxID=1891644 RepID=A0A7L4YT53_9ACTN|nr:MFS transporter [Epidermidibacterium keratini]
MPDERKMRRLAIASVLATGLEWFDFLIYATAAAIVFPGLFFPNADGVTGILASYGTFAIGFFARPLGGILAGHLGDKYGRKPPLVGAMVLMGLGTVAIGLLPGYATLGIWAPILLTVFRLVQGLGVGAQWGGAALLLVEHAPVERRGFYGSLVQMGTILGVMFGNGFYLLLTAMMSPQSFDSWGWRIPFLSGVLLVLVGVWLQLRIEDTPVFRTLQARSAQNDAPRKPPLLIAVRRYWKQILQAAGAFFVVNGTFYIFISGLLSYGVSALGLPRSQMLAAIMIAGATQIITIPYFGSLSDRHSRRKIFLIGAAAMAVFAFPMFWMVNTANVVVITIAMIIGFTIHASMFGPQAALYAEMFPADVRFSGASLGFQVAAVFAGGFAPIIMTALLGTAGAANSWRVALYIIAMAIITFVAVYTVRERYRADLHQMSEEVS